MNRTRTSICLILPLLFYTLFLFTNPLYFSTDSQEVADVVDGLYGENNFCQFLHPLLCVIIKPLNAIFPVTDVFTTLVHLAIFFCFTLLLYLGLESVVDAPIGKWALSDYISAALTILSVAFISFGMVIWNVNYNVQTAFFVFSGLLILSFSKRRGKQRKWFVFGAGFVAFGFMLRIEAALLFLPFIALEIITETIEKKRFTSRYLLPTVLIIALLFSSRVIFYQIEPYKTAIRYNVARTDCMDFPMKKWERLEKPDILAADYNAVTDWVLADTDIITAELMEKAAEAGGVNKYSLRNGFAPIFEDMWTRLTKTNLYMFALAVMTLILMVRNIIVCSKWRKIESGLSVLGGFIILFYFTIRGRAPLRVWEPVMFAADYALISAAIRDKSSEKIQIDLLFQLMLCVGLWFSAGQVMAHNDWKAPATTLNAKTNADESIFRNAFDPEGIYLWPNWFASIPWYYRDLDKLPPRWVLEHHIPVGDWTYGQPYFDSFLKEIDLENPAKALIERDNVYLMFGSDTLLDFLRIHYDEDFELIEVGELNGQIAYRVVRPETG